MMGVEEDPNGVPPDAGDGQGAVDGEHLLEDGDHQALTATSKKLAATVQPSGCYTNVPRAKGKVRCERRQVQGQGSG